MTHGPLQLVVLSLFIVAGLAAAAPVESFPGYAPNQRIMKAQEKGDQLFEKREYERAMLIYRKELAPLGDKFAQYMVGYMYLTGQGVDEDATRASAWYQLAAERGHESFVRARDVLWQTLNDEQKARSGQIYTDLRRELGDIAIISTLIDDDLAHLRRRNRPIPDLNLNPVQRRDIARNSDFYRKLRNQIESRMNYLLGLAQSDASIDIEWQDRIAKIDAEVRRELRALDASK